MRTCLNCGQILTADSCTNYGACAAARVGASLDNPSDAVFQAERDAEDRERTRQEEKPPLAPLEWLREANATQAARVAIVRETLGAQCRPLDGLYVFFSERRGAYLAGSLDQLHALAVEHPYDSDKSIELENDLHHAIPAEARDAIGFANTAGLWGAAAFLIWHYTRETNGSPIAQLQQALEETAKHAHRLGALVEHCITAHAKETRTIPDGVVITGKVRL